MREIEIFRAGRRVARDGAVADMSEADIAAAAQAYDPSASEAPVVVGHPADNCPAYGWVKRLRAEGPALLAELDQVDPMFAGLVNDGRYKKISASFYSPLSAENPRPGVWYLRHVGFLGAQPPAVKGLRPVCFSSSAEGVVEFATQQEPWERVMGMLRQARGMFAAKSGPAPEQTPYAEPTQAVSRFGNPHSTHKSYDAPPRRPLALAECESFIHKIAAEGKVLPRQKPFLVSFLASLPERGVVQFSEAGGVTQEPMGQAFRKYLEAMPRVVDYTERSAAGNEEHGAHAELGRKIAGAAMKSK